MRMMMGLTMRMSGVLRDLLAGAVVLAIAVPSAAAPAMCPPGRYFIPGQALIAGPSAPADDELYLSEISGILVAKVKSGRCPLAAAKMRSDGAETKVRARFSGCRDVPGGVVVKGTIAYPECGTLFGRVRAPGAYPRAERKKEFTALAAPDFAGPGGTLVGAMGGTYTNDIDGSRADVPPGAFVATQSATIGVTEISAPDVAWVDALLGTAVPAGLTRLASFQLLMDRNDPAPRGSLAASVADDGIVMDGTLLHTLTEPAFVAGVCDVRPSGFFYDGLATQSDGRYHVRFAPQSFGSPPGLSSVVHVPASQPTCTIDGVIRDGNGEATPFGEVGVSSLPGLVARAGADGYYRAIAIAGPNTVTATAAGSTGSVEIVCDPMLTATIPGVNVVVAAASASEIPVVTITDPATDESLAATTRLLTGTIDDPTVDRVTIVTHTGAIADGFTQMASVTDGAFASTVILTPGRANTLVVLARNPSTFRTGVASVVVTSTAAAGEDLRFTMAWDTNATDIDLHVRVPGANGVPDEVDGDTIYFSNRSAAGGVLDVDDTNGFGPENIVFPLGAAGPGTYAVAAHYWSGAPRPTTVTVSVFLSGVLVGSFTAVLSQDDAATPLAGRNPGSVFNIATVTFPGGAIGPPAAQTVFVNGPE